MPAEIRTLRIESKRTVSSELISCLVGLLRDYNIQCSVYFARSEIPILSSLPFIPMVFLDWISRTKQPQISSLNAEGILKSAILGKLDVIYYEKDCCLIWPISDSLVYFAHPRIDESSFSKLGITANYAGALSEIAQDQFL